MKKAKTICHQCGCFLLCKTRIAQTMRLAKKKQLNFVKSMKAVHICLLPGKSVNKYRKSHHHTKHIQNKTTERSEEEKACLSLMSLYFMSAFALTLM